jgi:uncharacterized membrane-anchored protein
MTMVLIVQFRVRRYVPALDRLVVVVISIVGTLIADTLADNLDVPLEATTIAFAALAVTPSGTWAERTLSVYTVDTLRREAFYWLAIRFTFAFGTAVDEFAAEMLGLGSVLTAVTFRSRR